jgi:hypothetical protein
MFSSINIMAAFLLWHLSSQQLSKKVALALVYREKVALALVYREKERPRDMLLDHAHGQPHMRWLHVQHCRQGMIVNTMVFKDT